MSHCSQTTTAVRAAIDSDRAHGAIVPPLVLSSNFSFQGYAQPRQYDYTRSGNPTRDALAGALYGASGIPSQLRAGVSGAQRIAALAQSLAAGAAR